MVTRHSDIELPPFSRENLHRDLDRMLRAFESKGMRVGESLLPPLSAAQLEAQCSWFPGELTEDIIALYAWRGGQPGDAWESEFPFVFRDNSFCSITRAETEYNSMMDSYGREPASHEMLKYAFPIASFDGSWFVIPTKTHNLDSALPRPVISVFEGIDIYFYSLEKMVATCADWVEHPAWSEGGFNRDGVELEIWNSHNPGVFS